MLDALGTEPTDAAALALLQQLTASADERLGPRDWTLLAVALARAMQPGSVRASARLPRWPAARRPLVLAISGAQGSGKTTLARALEAALSTAGARAVAVSLDDFYLTRDERRRLADEVHPLLATRGVPGTHDLTLLHRVLQSLGGSGTVALPGFDKGLDDRLPPARWRVVTAPLDVLIIEGWCLGIEPQPEAALEPPCNDLEAREDAGGDWRRYVNAALAGPYARLWQRFDGLVFLRVPGMPAVARWRALQEQAVEPARRMDAAALARFIAHYQRLTQWALQRVPSGAGLIVDLDDDHRITGIRPRPPPVGHSESVQSGGDTMPSA